MRRTWGGLGRPPFFVLVGEFWFVLWLKTLEKSSSAYPIGGFVEGCQIAMARHHNDSVAMTCLAWRLGKCQDPDLNGGRCDNSRPRAHELV